MCCPSFEQVTGTAGKHHLLWLTRRGRQVWRLQVALQAEADMHLRHLELADPPTVGFHVRGGDKLDEDKNGASASSFSLACPLSMQQSSFCCREPWQEKRISHPTSKQQARFSYHDLFEFQLQARRENFEDS